MDALLKALRTVQCEAVEAPFEGEAMGERDLSQACSP